MGQPMIKIWPEAYESLNEIYEEYVFIYLFTQKKGNLFVHTFIITSHHRVIATSKGQFRDDFLFLLHRDGYTEETYFSFTFSPMFTKDGAVGGAFCTGQEMTQRVLTTRRLRTLGNLGNKTTGKSHA